MEMYNLDHSINWEIRSDSASDNGDDDGRIAADGNDIADIDGKPYRPEAEHLDDGLKPYGRAG